MTAQQNEVHFHRVSERSFGSRDVIHGPYEIRTCELVPSRLPSAR